MVTSELSSFVSATTKLPNPSGLKTDIKDEDKSVFLEWVNNDDSPDGGVKVMRSDDGGDTWSSLDGVFSPNTESYTDNSVSEGETYDYQIERETDHTTSKSSVVTSKVRIEIGTLRINKNGEDINIPVYSIPSLNETWLRVDVKGDGVGALRLVDKSDSPLHTRNPSDGSVVGVESRTV